jgi:hypothetical protein
MTQPTIAPALTAEEWEEEVYIDAPGVCIDVQADILTIEPHEMGTDVDTGEAMWRFDPARRIDPERRHALAAFALYRQPFGFAREDVEAIRTAARYWGLHLESADRLEAIAQRIEALLPPSSLSGL